MKWCVAADGAMAVAGDDSIGVPSPAGATVPETVVPCWWKKAAWGCWRGHNHAGERCSKCTIVVMICKEPAVSMLSPQMCSDCEPTAGSLCADSGGKGEGRGERTMQGHDSEHKRANAEQ
jgi:hypothetical protein